MTISDLPPANDDEAKVPAYTPHDLGLDGTAATLALRQRDWRAIFAEHVYGAIPPPPDAVEIARTRVADEGYDRLRLTLRCGPRVHVVDAALWLPPDALGPVPLVVGLGFIGPAGVLFGDSFPLDPDAAVESPPERGLVDRRLAPQVRGIHAARWPLPPILGAGCGLLLSCYGSWTPDCPRRWQQRGAWPLMAPAAGEGQPGALSLWAWAFRRLVDVAGRLAEVDPGRIAVAGHSRLGKAALWAAATDERIAAAFANNAGCLGPALSCRGFGETPRHLAAQFPHWVAPRLAATVRDGGVPPVDQHALLAAIAPRRVNLASASLDWWADPRGEYEGLRAALPAWGDAAALPTWDAVAAPGSAVAAGAVAWHLRPGGHDLTPWDWRHFLGCLAAAEAPVAG
ncbi:MAG: hypothetical protein R3F55_16230 [Alphaproteobacteria bacterium]